MKKRILYNRMAVYVMRLRELRESKGLSLDRLSQDLHINKSTLSRIENGLREPKQSFIEDCAKYFNVSIDYFLGGELNKKPKGVKIPVLGRVQAGVPIEAVADIIDYEEITEELNRTGDFFALQVTGNSMEPRMLEGDVVIVRKQSYIESGEVAIVLVNGCDATIKKVIKQDNGLLLVASNSEAYQPTFYSSEAIERLPVSIIGKVVELRGKF